MKRAAIGLEIPARSAFSPRSLTLIMQTKGYAGGLVSFRRTDCLDIGSLGASVPMMWVVSFTCLLPRPFGVVASGMMTMCERFSLVKDSASGLRGNPWVWCFQLESLILAQNERWRQA